jgi:hypothetical protein
MKHALNSTGLQNLPNAGETSVTYAPATPSTPDPAAFTEPEASLPLWIVPLIFAGLFAFCSMIAFLGLLVMQPASRPAIEPVPHVNAAEFSPEAKPAPVPEKSLIPDEEPVVSEEPAPREPIQLQRRMPSAPEKPQAPILEPALEATPAEPPMPPLEEKGVALRAPLRWSVESSRSSSMNLIMPIEIAKIDNGIMSYSVRRLRFTDVAPKQLKLAVTPVVHDDLGTILTKMGEGYSFTRLRSEDLFFVETLKKHDVVFLTCADLYARDFQSALPLRQFVINGGTLYASDLRGDLILAAFPEFRATFPIMSGVPQSLEANVVEPGLRSYLGRRAIPLNFDAPDWRPAAFDPNKVTVCLKGTYRNNLGQVSSVPLLVKFRVQKGTVIFTSFHHTKNDSEIVQKLLEYLVFSSISARSEARVKDLMSRSHFAPQEMRPVVVSTDKGIDAIYQHPGGGMQMALGFENLGAKLKLTLHSPTGKMVEHEDHGLYLIEIPKAEPGAWRYTVTPIELPHANFPLIVAIGGVKS